MSSYRKPSVSWLAIIILVVIMLISLNLFETRTGSLSAIGLFGLLWSLVSAFFLKNKIHEGIKDRDKFRRKK